MPTSPRFAFTDGPKVTAPAGTTLENATPAQKFSAANANQLMANDNALDADLKALAARTVEGMERVGNSLNFTIVSGGPLDFPAPAVGTKNGLWIAGVGQSNFDGNPPISELPAGWGGYVPGTSIRTPATAGFQAMNPGVNTATLGGNNFGMEVSLCNRLFGRFGQHVWYTKTGLGGDALAQDSNYQDWSPNSMNEDFDKAKANMLASAVELGEPTRTPDFYVFYQGESDRLGSYAVNYQTNLTAFIAATRALFPQGATMPFIIVRIHIMDGSADTLAIRTAQAAVAQAVPNCYLVSVDDLTLRGDGLHLDGPGQIGLGQRVFGVVEAVLTGGAIPVVKTTPAAPSLSPDDLADTLGVSHALGVAEIEVSVNQANPIPLANVTGWNATDQRIVIGDVALAAQYYRFRARATSTRNPSPYALSPAFTTGVVVAPTGPPAGTNLVSSDLVADWQSVYLEPIVGGKPDAHGGNTAYNLTPSYEPQNIHTLYKNVSNTANNYKVYVELKGVGVDYFSLKAQTQSFGDLGIASLINLTNGTSAGTAATITALANGWYGVLMPFAVSQDFMFWWRPTNSTDTAFPGNGQVGQNNGTNLVLIANVKLVAA